MSPEQAEAAVLRHESDVNFLIWCGQKLEAESLRRRVADEAPMTQADAAALLAPPATA